MENKRVLLEHEVSDWLLIWTAVFSLDAKGIFLVNRSVFPKYGYICYNCMYSKT